MFTGIIEDLGKLVSIEKKDSNLIFELECSFTNELKIDQSLAHNGVCLTVIEISGNNYKVEAIEETLNRTNLGLLSVGDEVNLERCLLPTQRLDGHIVQGHVDQIGECYNIVENDGSWEFFFRYDNSTGNLTVEKGSICVNGVSLTVVHSTENEFSVCIIPYTYEYTSFKNINVGSKINLEFDIIGKYVSKLGKGYSGAITV